MMRKERRSSGNEAEKRGSGQKKAYGSKKSSGQPFPKGKERRSATGRKFNSDEDSEERRKGKAPYAKRKYSEDNTKNYSDRKPFIKRERKKKINNSNEIRLNRFISNSGICSRREADEYISTGLVTVDGVIVTELGTKVTPDSDVRFNGERLKGEKKVYVLLNKPKNYVTTLDDPQERKTVIDLVKDACKERIYPVGRLDRNTMGVLLLTNDGELTRQLTHPSFMKKKIYHAFLDKNVSHTDMQALLDGIILEDGPIAADAIEYVNGKKSEIGIEVHSGRNRIIRRMFAHLGYQVIKLDRVYFAGLTKKNLRRGEWRMLTTKEIEMLKMGAYE